ncbi:MAG: protein kinase [Rhodothermia bacterium]
MEGDGHTQDPFDITGKRFSHYFVGRRVAVGGMGMVYEAEDERLGRRVALKVLPPWSRFDDKARARFAREAKAASALNHPNICTVYEYDDIAGRPLIAMEFVEGTTLAGRIKEGPLPRDEAVKVIGRVAAGLEHAHIRNVVHRDIKPGNILLGDDGRVKIPDFGLAKLTDSTTHTQTGATFGTVAYMSPEQANGEETDSASDIWSLGTVLFEALTGERPFPGEHASSVLYRILNTEPVGIDRLALEHGEPTADLIRRCLDKDPSGRPTAREVLEFRPSEATTFLEHDSVGVKYPRRWLISATAGVAAVVATMVVVTTGDGLTERPPLESSTMAILPPVVSEITMRATLGGLVESSVREVAEQAVDLDLIGQIAPFAGADVKQPVETADDAFRILGVHYALAAELADNGVNQSLKISLVDTRSLDTLRTETAALHDDIRESKTAIVETIAIVFGLPDYSPESNGPPTPGSAEFYARGLGLLQQRSNPTSVEAAIILLQSAVEESPDFAEAYAELGRAFLYLYDERPDVALLDRAARLCSDALELDPNLTSVYVTLGKINGKKGHFGLAISDFDRALEKNADDTEALLGKAAVLEKQGMIDKAESLFNVAITTRPDYWGGYRNLGLFLFRQSRFAEAAEQFRIVVSLAPYNHLGFRSLGSAYFYLEQFELARTNWERARELAPDDDATYSNLATLYFYHLFDYQRAVDLYKRALSKDDSDYLVWGNLGTAYYYLPGMEDSFRTAKTKAIELAEQKLKMNPRDYFVRAKLAAFHVQLDDTVQALDYLAEFGKKPDADLLGETVFEVGTAWEELGYRDTALGWLSEALARNYPQTELIRYPGLENLRNDPRFSELIKSIPIESEGDTPG